MNSAFGYVKRGSNGLNHHIKRLRRAPGKDQLDRNSRPTFAQGEDPGDARPSDQRAEDDSQADAGWRRRVPDQHESRQPEAESQAGRPYSSTGEGVQAPD